MANLVKQRQTLHRQLAHNEERIASLEEQIRATQKMATLGTMACLAAHEFNNILVPMINYSELALQHPDDLPLMRKALEKTIEHGNRASVIIQSMLGLVRDQGEQRQWVRLAEIVHECFQCMARDLKKDQITVDKVVPDELEVFVVPGQLLQVLLNLIINSRQAMLQKGGTLRLAAEKNDQGAVTITVSDTGCGMPPQVVERIFEPFFSTKTDERHPEQRGTGLGLMVCKDIVESHSGAISVSSTPGQGTVFTIALPQPEKEQASP